MSEEIAFLSAAETARAIRARQLSPVEIAQALLERIERLNPQLNAYLTPTPELALESARAAEQAVLRGDDLGPLQGVPVSIKDLAALKGAPMTQGSLLYKNHVPDYDDPAVERIRAAGAVILGKTNTPEFGSIGFTENRLGDPCRNPWNPARTSGGSSGGAGAALAAGLGPLAHGTDGGGSIRIPASFCGVFGLKPTYGRVPRWSPVSGWGNLSHTGPMARTVEDAALFLEVMAGQDPRDPWSLPNPGGYVSNLRAGIRGLRVAWSPDLGWGVVEPEVRAIAERAARRFQELGCTVEEGSPRMEDPNANRVFGRIALAETAAAHGADLDAHPELLCDYNARIIQWARQLSAVEYVQAMEGRAAVWGACRDFFEKYDLLLTPTMAVTGFPHGQEPREVGGVRVRPFGWSPFTVPFNLTGQPAASVPCGWSAEGLPVGLQIVGRPFADLTVLQAAAAFEEAQPWADRLPPLH